MSAHEIDNRADHLYPDFRKKLEAVMAEAPGGPWALVEGYRSQERQTYLYSLGRTRAGSIVTWMKTPRNHGAGLAADLVPAAGYKAPRSTWEGLRKVYLRHGLENPAWSKGDLGHVQWPASDEQTNEEARDWCEAGFPPPFPGYEPVPVFLRGQKIADGQMRPGQVWAPLRTLTEALGLEITQVQGDAAMVQLVRPDEVFGEKVPLEIEAGRGWSPVRPVARVAGLPVALKGGRVVIG